MKVCTLNELPCFECLLGLVSSGTPVYDPLLKVLRKGSANSISPESIRLHLPYFNFKRVRSDRKLSISAISGQRLLSPHFTYYTKYVYAVLLMNAYFPLKQTISYRCAVYMHLAILSLFPHQKVRCSSQNERL